MNNNLERQANTYVEAHGRKRRWHKVVTALAAVVVFCTTYALIMPAVTMQSQTYCGYEEHAEHTDACYQRLETLTCELSEESHIHDESCYETEEVLICGKELHRHTLQCYADPDADVESASAWESTFSSVERTGKWSDDVLSIAQTQIGYQESIRNYRVQEDDTTIKGYTRYGDWYGSAYGDWCAMFCSFCLHYAGVDQELVPLAANCEDWIEQLSQTDRYHGSSTYTPKPGDLIFFDWEGETQQETLQAAVDTVDHVGIVYEVIAATEDTPAQIKTIEGNNGDEVAYHTYDLDSACILGYGELPEQPEYSEEADSLPDESEKVDHMSADVSRQDDTALLAIQPLGGAVKDTYYQRVSKIDDSSANYLIISAEGSYALTLTGSGSASVSGTKVQLVPVKGNPGYYTIADVNDAMRWRFGTTGDTGSAGTVQNVGANGRYLRMDRYNLFGADSRSLTRTYDGTTGTWTLSASAYYLWNEDGTFSRNRGISDIYCRNMLILKQVSTTLDVPDDPAGSGGSGGGSEEEVRPDYPAYVETSGAVRRSTSVSDVSGRAYSDPATSQLEASLSGAKADDGRVLADKSVIYQKDDYGAFSDYDANTFGVTLSALGQQYALAENDKVVTPIDVVFVLDVSGSMNNKTTSGETRRAALVNAANSAMGQIFAQHSENRAGVVVYSSGSWDLLDIDRYSPGDKGQYLTLTSGGNVYSATNLKNSSGSVVVRKTDSNQQQGTYTQSGIARGAAMFERVQDTTYTTTVGSGESQRTVTVERQPVIILLSDGDPTHCTSNYTDVLAGPHYGNGSYPSADNNKGIQGYYTILSANYYKSMVGIHYNQTAKFYTVGMGINETGVADLSGNSATGDHYKRAVLNPTAKNISALTNDGGAKNPGVTSHQLRDLLNGNYTGQYVTVGSTNSYAQLGRTNANVPVISNPYANYSYADGAYFGNITQSQLTEIFSEIVASSLQVKNYGFILVKRSSVELVDPIGEGMQVNSDPVLNYGGQNYVCTAKKTDGNVTTYSYDYRYKAADGSGFSASLGEIVVTVSTDLGTGLQTVRMTVPDDVLPVYAPCETVGEDWYYEALPVRLIYQVGLTEAAVQEIEGLHVGQSKAYYTNRYDLSHLDAGAGATLKPMEDNPYYMQDDPYGDAPKSKTDNATDTAATSCEAKREAVIYQGESVSQITYYLGNNGKLVFEGIIPDNVPLTLQKTDMSGNPIVTGPAEFALYDDETLRNEIGTYTTDGSGKLTIEKLTPNTPYYLKETKAPDGYYCLQEAQKFTVDVNGNVTGIDANKYFKWDDEEKILLVYNTDGYELPESGGVGTTCYTFCGLLLMTVPAMYGYAMRRKREGGTD